MAKVKEKIGKDQAKGRTIARQKKRERRLETIDRICACVLSTNFHAFRVTSFYYIDVGNKEKTRNNLKWNVRIISSPLLTIERLATVERTRGVSVRAGQREAV